MESYITNSVRYDTKREKPSHNGTVQLKLDEKLQKRTNTHTNIHTVLFKLPSEYAKDMRPLNT